MTLSYRILIILLCSFAFLSLPSQAQAARCFAAKPIMAFSPTVSSTKFSISRSAFDLHRLHGGAQGGLVTGLALSPLYYEFQGEYKITQRGDEYCLSLDKLKIAYRARPIVFISSEFPRGSCEFNAVLKHENKHVAALRKVHSRTAGDFKKHVENSLDRIRPVKLKSPAEIERAQKKMRAQFSELLDQYITEVNGELAYEQNKIDSPSEYQRVSAECTDWAGRLRLR